MEEQDFRLEEEALEFLVDAPDITDEQLRDLSSREDLCDACRDALSMASAVRAQQPVNVEARLAEFHRSHPKARVHRLPYYLGAAVAVAAVILLVFLLRPSSALQVPEGTTMVYQAVASASADTSVVLKSQSGKRLVLNSEQATTPSLNLTKTSISESSEMMTLLVPTGESYDLTLSDGTQVMLHPGSQLMFPSKFEGSQRRVTLEGEAYFKVAHDDRHPFLVKAGNIETLVLGTEFSIAAYPDTNPQVTLVTGKIGVTTTTFSKVLTPGQQITVKEGDVQTHMVDITPFTMWRDGYLFFDNVTIEELLRSLGRYYNCSVVFYNNVPLNDRMRFAADRRSNLQQALNTLNSMKKLTATLEDNIIVVR